MRRAHVDSDVKGTGNEQIVAELIQDNMAHRTIVTNCSIIDAQSGRSGEIDIAICNEYQPFLARGQAEVLLIEGVDAVVQVKAQLNGKEIKRMVRNCQTVKRLMRSAHKGDQCYSNQHDVPHFVNRSPYITFAFDSALSAATALDQIRNEHAGLPSEEQLDAVFVLDKFAIFNVRNNEGVLNIEAVDGRKAYGFEGVATNDDTLRHRHESDQAKGL